jgi:agmatinase
VLEGRKMSYLELFVSQSPIFSGCQRTFDEANFVVLGVPFDFTSTFRTGARFGPLAIREASQNIETYSFRSSIDAEDLKIHDSGDVHITGNTSETLKRLELVVKDVLDARKTPIIIGGEHTITLGATRALGKNAAILSFDAHLDLRNEYQEQKLSHTTFMRRIFEQVHPKKILEVGTRAACKEELSYAKKSQIQFFTTQQIGKDGIEETTRKINKILDDVSKVYLTIDMDVLDPAFAPAVQNPEPDGLCTGTFHDILCEVCDGRIIGFDLVEVAPHYDSGITAIQAAKIVFEVMCRIEKARKNP